MTTTKCTNAFMLGKRTGEGRVGKAEILLEELMAVNLSKSGKRHQINFQNNLKGVQI